jgi:hypothetical protein
MRNYVNSPRACVAAAVFFAALAPGAARAAVVQLEFEDFLGPGGVLPRSAASGSATHEILSSTLPPEQDTNMLQAPFLVAQSGLYRVDFVRYSNDNESPERERVQLFVDDFTNVVFDFVSGNTRPDGFPLGSGWNIFATVDGSSPNVSNATDFPLLAGPHVLWVRSTGGDGFHVEGDSLRLRMVPEPSALLLAATGGLVAAFLSWRRLQTRNLRRLQPPAASRRAAPEAGPHD